MNVLLMSAGLMSLVLGIAHSFLGERLLFKNKRPKGSFLPLLGGTVYTKRQMGILWATWHLATFFGLQAGAILLFVSRNYAVYASSSVTFILISIAIAMALGGFLVWYGTKAKHPGWIVLWSIAILITIGL